MSRARVAVLKVISRQLSVTAAAAEYGYSRQHLHRLVARYKAGGLEAVEARSRRPRSNPRATEDKVRGFIIKTRLELTAAGWDAGPVTIAWHLERAGLHVPSTSTIRRILHAAGLVTPEPGKRPRSSYRRFQAAQPNQCWQSDFTHWPLDGGAGAEIINWLDDHSRYLLACSAWAPVTGTVVAGTFLQAGNTYGLPASTLTDNGRVCTARSGGGRNAFEYLLAALGITQKNGKPNHPQTQGKAERFHQTQKRWLAQQPPVATLGELQRQLDAFREHYNCSSGKTSSRKLRLKPQGSNQSCVTICDAMRPEGFPRDGEPQPSACDTQCEAECETERLRRSGRDPEPIVWYFVIEQACEKWWS